MGSGIWLGKIIFMVEFVVVIFFATAEAGSVVLQVCTLSPRWRCSAE